jgi:hypothetical protein
VFEGGERLPEASSARTKYIDWKGVEAVSLNVWFVVIPAGRGSQRTV